MAERPNKRRTPKVAGRSTSRVEISRQAQDRRESTADAAVDTTVVPESTDTPETPRRGVGLRKPTGESGVERKRRAAEQERSDAAAERERADVEPGAHDTGGTYRMAAIVGAVAVLLGVVATVLAVHPGASTSANKAFVDKGESEKVLAQARDSLCAPFQFKYGELDKWLGNVESKLTGQARREFLANVDSSRSLVEQTKASQDCRVDAVGLLDLSHDRAEVLTNLVVSTTREGSIAASDMPQLRVVMTREDGVWRPSEILEP
ncbi:hypothetical protein [Gordonia humi]|uniref:Mce-associated membrane protein n=2 Tax=Gordonia humi TaxID=686429 RepID=A0A840EPV8_9ACTN|nr:hypothetical protein [Gordonia humi]MBB4134865.1 Mce-associated membrane protein [Gordonia humi]